MNLAGRSLAEMKPTFRATLLGGVHLRRVIRLVDELGSADAREVVAGLPAELARKVVPSLIDCGDRCRK